MRWGLLCAALVAFGCADQTPPTVPGGPGSGIGNGSGGEGGGGGIGGAGGEGGDDGGKGACNNESDLLAIDGAPRYLRDEARDCAVAICISPIFEECVSECVQNRVPGLSSECADCYSAAEKCSFESGCRINCSQNTCLDLCLECMNDAGCITDLEACTGIPDQCG